LYLSFSNAQFSKRIFANGEKNVKDGPQRRAGGLFWAAPESASHMTLA
jgi:hypothetical protein